MIFKFCPDCGQKIEAAFNFCPSCGFKIPKETEEEVQPVTAQSTASPAQTVPSAEVPKTKHTPVKIIYPKKELASPKRKRETETSFQSSPTKVSPALRNPKGKRQKSNQLEPIPGQTILTDQNNKKWKLVELLSQSETESGLLYSAQQGAGPSQPCKYVVKVDAKDGRIFNEQNFLQRAAKRSKVDKWVKSHMKAFLGIPTCVGFGFHENTYRFLVFPNLGNSLQSILEKTKKPLSEKAVLQLSYRMIDVLEYIHTNEYVHADIKAENIYVNPNDLEQVYLVGYYFAFRYCPDGKHVEYREGSRTPHEGTVELISVDIHKGAGPSRRSDFETLGYCMLKALCGSLPWSDNVDFPHSVMEAKQKYKADLPSLLKDCFGRKKFPDELKRYLQRVVSLKYDEEPDYEELRKQLKYGLDRLGTSPDGPMDLTITTI
ncbi:inactive serine/threonine-protein kinase VRK3-like isoform X1 [Carcharodon carcharias]|uniref:inactive serine/threonine-protein kinase VRK3-like isoform X1 n=1 Tax=Carcharodon carcharias TaxID=13397 RepID=UPI001B7E1DFC|nr:inactive serine/threonine-protein kinase VRK3-like isoform X1 [Carcharodon carcharias]